MPANTRPSKGSSQKHKQSNKSSKLLSTITARPSLKPDSLSSSSISTTLYNYSLWNLWVASTLLKILLFPSYHSTDFDVHRNWLAITNKLPLKLWYIENTSQWTLDYPPFFAYFEYILSQFVPASVARDGCLDIVSKGQYGFKTVIFQRTTVIISELVLFFALQWFINISSSQQSKKRAFVIASSIVLSPGLFIVDHIHFQYNGMMFGILIISLISAKLKRYLLCGLSFSILLCFKHIFLYLAPAYFIFLLSAYCLELSKLKQNWKTLLTSNPFKLVKWFNLMKLGSVVLIPFILAFAPFVYYGVMPNLLQRLFPFSRGLTHAYWAPNIWAIYSFVDRILIQMSFKIPTFMANFFNLNPSLLQSQLIESSSASTKGLVGEVEFFVLPTITPSITFILTLFYQIMSLVPLFFSPTFERFIGSLTLCGFASFLFGWHVHEKAIMLVIIPFSFITTKNRKLLPLFQMLSASGYVSLFPLLYGSSEWLFKTLITLIWCIIFFTSFRSVTPIQKDNLTGRKFLLDRLNLIYIVLLAPMAIIVQAMDIEARNFEILRKLEFLRLVVYSVSCSVGIVGAWNGLSWLYFLDDEIWKEEIE